MKRILLCLPIVPILAFVGSCGEDPAAPPDPALKITISVDVESISVGDEVLVTVEAENPTSSDIEFGFGYDVCVLDVVVRVNEVDHDLSYFKGGGCRVLPEWAVEVPLLVEAGETIRQELIWTGQLLGDNELVPLSLGQYELYGYAGEFTGPPCTIEITE